MKPPNETLTGNIVGYDERRGEILVRVPYDDHITMLRREYSKCLVQLVDRRPLSDKQRRACYALIGEIAEYIGDDREETKEFLKLQFMANELEETADSIFSLANAPMSLVCAFQKYMVRFIVKHDIPCKFSLLEYVDDVSDYIYSCMIHKKCVICGRKADLHHVDRVGTGRDRTEIVHEGMEAMPLCREHHTDCHSIGQNTFNERYHLPGGIILDKTLCKIYKLNKEK